MLTLLFRKMKNTKWMVLCLLAGFIMASAMISTIPVYMNSSLQRMLTKDMESYQIENGVYPGTYSVGYDLPLDISAQNQQNIISAMNETAEKNYNNLGVPTKAEKKVLTDKYLYAANEGIKSDNSAARFYLTGMTDISDHVKITKGRMFKTDRSDGVFECITTENSLHETGLELGVVYDIANVFNSGNQTKMEVVGIFDVAEETDPFWSEGLDDAYVSTMFTDYDVMYGYAIETGVVSATSMCDRYLIDYENMDMTSLSSVTDLLSEQNKVYTSEAMTLDVPALAILEDYAERSAQLKLILWLVQIPVMLMIVFYLFMVSRLNVEQEKNEIAVLKSRGASRAQVMFIYALESLVLGVITVLTGPFLGLGLCRILGASNGFLEFVNRTALPIRLSAEAFLYALLAVCVFFFTTMIPIYPATKPTIVEHKASQASKRKIPLWEKTGVDIILIAGSAAWLYFYQKTQDQLISQGVSDTTATANPILFVASTAFILGAALFAVRIYPYLVRLVYIIGKRFWSPAQYVSLNNISRSSTGRERFIMVFLMLTVSMGLFFANTARAINRNVEEKVLYSVGADAVIAEDWDDSSESEAQYSSSAEAAAAQSQQETEQSEDEDDETESSVTYIEPVYERFEKLSGVNSTAKVFKKSGVSIQSDRSFLYETVVEDRGWDGGRDGGAERTRQETTDTVLNVELMAVSPGEFSNVCWMKDSLLPLHINHYLNALTECNYGVILSQSFADKYGYELGDEINVSWGGNQAFPATVTAFVDYWPSLNPLEKNEDGSYIDFAVMNLDYVQVQSSVEPYEVWIDLGDDALVEDFYNSIEESDITPTKLEVSSQQIVSEKNDPMLQGLNGALTLGFIIIMIMCIIGFLIYWILSIKSRTLQFGILRAMGMSFREIIGLLFYEQLLVSGVSIVISVVIGSVVSNLFVPLFQSLYNSSDTVPPFSVLPQRSDYIKIYIIVGLMLLICFLILGKIISRIKISQALKLGED